jgi:Flp pilus assembly protein TadD
VALGVEIIYVRDHMGDGDWYRMNTVFKFGIQSWLLLTIGLVSLVPLLWQKVRNWPYQLSNVLLAVLIAPLVLGAVYPIFGVPNRMQYRVVRDQAPTLDGLAFMEKGSYSAYDANIDFVSDYRAIQWLNDNVTGTPVIMHSSIEFYRGYGVRIAANTGLPTVVSPLHESEQRNGDLVGKRDADVIEFYRSTDLTKKRQLLSRYRVAYVVVGPIERAAYGSSGVDLISEMPDVRQVFESGATTIYRVSPQIVSIPPLDSVDGSRSERSVSAPAEPEPEPVYIDTATLLKAYEEDPSNVTVMMQLVDAYRRTGNSIGASDVLFKTAQLVPNDIMVLHMLGDISAEARLNDRSINAYKAAIAVNNNPGNVNKLLSGYMMMGMFEEALKATNQAISEYPDFADFYFTRGKIHEMLGDIADARSDYRAYLENSPDNAIFRQDVLDALDRLDR